MVLVKITYKKHSVLFYKQQKAQLAASLVKSFLDIFKRKGRI